jgi:hypothetical protein
MIYLPCTVCHGRAMTQAFSLWVLTTKARVCAPVSPCEICGGQSGTGIGFLRVLRFSPVIIIPLCLFMLIYHLGDMNNRPVGGRSSETLPYSMDLNNNNKVCNVDGVRLRL